MNLQPKSYSQYQQDLFIFNNFFKNKHSGYFVDIGAHDGVTYSNSLFFENLGWSGLCIEPIKRVYDKLTQNRKCECLYGAISDKKTDFVEFCNIEGYSEMLSGILEDYDNRHKARILNEEKIYKTKRSKVKVPNFNFNDFVKNKTIDILDIDTEGNELSILKSIDYKTYSIGVILVENNFDTPNIKNFLTPLRFEFVQKLGADELYKNHEYMF